MQIPKTSPIVGAVVVVLSGAGLFGQSFRQGGTEFSAMRPVEIPANQPASVVVTEFLHHGQINADGSSVTGSNNVLVAARNRRRVPVRLLQLGPGDFCRLAFQPIRGQTIYEVYYGGAPPKEKPPLWTAQDGLLLQTRRYQDCDLGSLDSVRRAFESSEPFGSDYVESVRHAYNPFSLKPGPFLSRYSGYLRIDSAGTYGFVTSSRDCSFLLIDGKLVVSAPGRHGPARRALRGSRQDVQLSARPHKFEYYHAAVGPSAVMLAAWEVSPADRKPQPALIPSKVFRAEAIVRAPAGSVSLRTARLVPDFTLKIEGDVPLPDNDVALIGVRFGNTSPGALTLSSKLLWEFGDGQTSEQASPVHVYLRPGLYTVKLTVKRGTRSVEMINRLQIDRPRLTAKDKLHALDDYLPILAGYDPRMLDAASLRQLVLAYRAKAEAVRAQTEAGQTVPQPPDHYLAAAVAAGKVALVEETAARDGTGLYRLAGLVGPMARDELGDSALAMQIWQGAVRRIRLAEPRIPESWADCAIEAADVAVNDLLKAADAKPLLDGAAKLLAQTRTGAMAAKLQRVWGDYYALTGDGKSARAAYGKAQERLGTGGRSFAERTAWRGAHSRSTEEFLTTGQYVRAAAQLRKWQSEFPADKIDGYLTLLYARYSAGRRLYARAIAQAEQLQAVNADSPYIDRLLLLAAQCEEKRNRPDRALATLRGLVSDYPGSPLLPQAKKTIARLEATDK